MPSLGGLFNVAATALHAHQRAAEVTAHNIANVATEGYSRQRVRLTPGPTISYAPQGSYGTGVRLRDIGRSRDAVLDMNYRRESALAAQDQRRAGLLSQMESVFAEPTEYGLNAEMDAFWGSWNELANEPNNASARRVVQQRGDALATRLRQASNELSALVEQGTSHLGVAVAEFNAATAQIAQLNDRIVAAGAAGESASDLRDQRDLLLDKLAGIASIQVVERAAGDVAVHMAGIAVVDKVGTTPLFAEPDGAGGYRLGIQGSSTTFVPNGGSLGGALRFLNQDLPPIRTRLDQIAAGLVSAVNAVHQTGMNAAGARNVDFFDPAGTTAGTIDLSAAVKADADQIAAGTGAYDAVSDTWTYRAGANDVAMAIVDLRDTAVLGTESLGIAYDGMVSGIGSSVASVGRSQAIHDSLALQAANSRESVSGVSIDEELTNLMQQQAAYSAAARIVTVADEMIRSLLDMV